MRTLLHPVQETHGDVDRGSRRRSGAPIRVLLVCLSLAWFSQGTASAAEFTCTGGSVNCLIAAINTANVNGEMNTIRLDASAYTLTAADNGSPFGVDANALPVVIGQITIRGLGRDATVIERVAPFSPFNRFRLFEVSNTGVLVLDDVTVRGGNGGRGGAIRSQGALTIRHSAIVNNAALSVSAVSVSSGTFVMTDTLVANNDAAFDLGTMEIDGFGTVATIARSLFADNRVEVGFVIGVGPGATATVTDSAVVRTITFGESAGIGAFQGGSVAITNVTVAGHRGDLARGVYALPGSSVSIRHSTITDNSTNVTGPVRVENSILGSNRFGNCGSAITSLGHNVLEEPQGCGVLSPDDVIVGTGRARLGALVDTGMTAYVPLLPDSPAIDAAGATACVATDLRGLPRPIDGNADGTRACDAGAVEFYPVVNDLLRLDAVTGEYVRPSAPPNALTAGGEFRISAVFTNLDPADICNVAFEVVTLNGTAPPVVLTQDGQPIGGQGSAVTASAAGGPRHLASQAHQQYRFRVGVPQPERISFQVNVLGEATAGPCGP